ncbi:tRNA1(Val) (adenine(37)-N6)-methyltransferase [Rhodobacter ferrooxidans]|uniref:Methyltransferase small n=1 Tax=Rhodobacter ferrooxidans TaxID=371731 RepID=C8S2E4_9RHOB|nr:methyltransferase [Rhodobacter sp. SW2]EEW24815.1 methyltransferase small [Rhodobacter sp. SW2]
MFAETDLSDDAFLGGRLHLLQPRRGYRAASDPVLLAACVGASAGQSVLDLGCGAGTAVLCLGARVPGLALAGLELQADYADLARRNAARNGLALEVVEGDLAQMPGVLLRDFDHVIANPPYYPTTGSASPDAGRDMALRTSQPLALWIESATRRLAPGGWLTLILGTDRLPEALAAMDARLGSVAVLPLAPREGRPALRVIVQARKGGRAAFRLLPPFIMHAGVAHDIDRDSHSPQARAVLRDGADLCDLWR